LQVVEPPQQSLEIADPVAIGVHIGADREAIKDAVLVPEIVDHPSENPVVRFYLRPKPAQDDK